MSGDFGGDALDRLGDRAGARHLVVVRLQRRLEEAQDRRLVVDHQDAGLCASCRRVLAREGQHEAGAAAVRRPGFRPRSSRHAPP